MAYDSHVRIVQDHVVLSNVSKWHDFNFVVLGGPMHNRLAASIHLKSLHSVDAAELEGPAAGVQWSHDASSIRIGPCNYSGAGTALLALVPSGRGSQVALLVAGIDKPGLKTALHLGIPTIPPMTRAPYTNMLPDYVVTEEVLFEAKGLGGFRAAGYWGHNWQWNSQTSYESC
jgi:hypothetical protein